MKFTLSWLKDHLDTTASVAQVADAMTMAGLEVEHVDDPAAKFAAFSVARIKAAVQHPNADRLRVCQVETKDGMKEIVCGAPNARAGLTTVYAPIGTYIPGTGITLEPRPVRGVVSNGMLCSAAELEIAEDADGILELAGDLAVGASAAEALGLEAVIDFEVTPNRPDWLGVAGIARDLAATGLGKFKDVDVQPINGAYPCPIEIRLDGSDACPMFAGRLIRGVKNGPSPAWLQARLHAIGLRPISALVDITNLISYDRARPLHVYDAAKLKGGFIEARLGREGEELAALDGQTYNVTPEMCVIGDGSGAVGLGGVMGGSSTGCSETTTEVFVESAWFDPIRTAQTGRDTGIISDAHSRCARGVDPGFGGPGLELATKLMLELCGGEASAVRIAGHELASPPAVTFDPAYVAKLSGLEISRERTLEILSVLGFVFQDKGKSLTVQPPSWRRDVEGKADLVEEVARIAGYDTLPATPLPELAMPPGGVLTVRQGRAATARRALAALGYAEAVTWSFMPHGRAERGGGGQAGLMRGHPIAAELDCMRPSILPKLIEAAQRNANRGFADVALFEIGPVFSGDRPQDQRTAIAAILSPHAPRRWGGGRSDDLFALKADLMSLLDDARRAGQLAAGGARRRGVLVASRPFGAAAAWAKGGDRRVRRLAPLRPRRPRCGRSGLWIRDLARGHARAQAQGDQDQAGPEPLALHAAPARLRLRGGRGLGRSQPRPRRYGRRQGPDRPRLAVRRLYRRRRPGGQEVTGVGGHDPTGRPHADGGGDRNAVGAHRRGCGKSGGCETERLRASHSSSSPAGAGRNAGDP